MDEKWSHLPKTKSELWQAVHKEIPHHTRWSQDPQDVDHEKAGTTLGANQETLKQYSKEQSDTAINSQDNQHVHDNIQNQALRNITGAMKCNPLLSY